MRASVRQTLRLGGNSNHHNGNFISTDGKQWIIQAISTDKFKARCAKTQSHRFEPISYESHENGRLHFREVSSIFKSSEVIHLNTWSSTVSLDICWKHKSRFKDHAELSDERRQFAPSLSFLKRDKWLFNNFCKQKFLVAQLTQLKFLIENQS